MHQGAADASVALGKWLGKRSVIEVDSLEQLPLDEATGVLGDSEEPLCFGATEITGRLRGELILAFDDASGLALADMLLDQRPGTATQWGEMERSAALETTNILCCAYLNSLAQCLPSPQDPSSALIPSPPRFSRDFAESLVQFALMGQAMASDRVFLGRTNFHVGGTALNCTLLFVPDADSLEVLQGLETSECEPFEDDTP